MTTGIHKRDDGQVYKSKVRIKVGNRDQKWIREGIYWRKRQKKMQKQIFKSKDRVRIESKYNAKIFMGG